MTATSEALLRGLYKRNPTCKVPGQVSLRLPCAMSTVLFTEAVFSTAGPQVFPKLAHSQGSPAELDKNIDPQVDPLGSPILLV